MRKLNGLYLRRKRARKFDGWHICATSKPDNEIVYVSTKSEPPRVMERSITLMIENGISKLCSYKNISTTIKVLMNQHVKSGLQRYNLKLPRSKCKFD